MPLVEGKEFMGHTVENITLLPKVLSPTLTRRQRYHPPPFRPKVVKRGDLCSVGVLQLNIEAIQMVTHEPESKKAHLIDRSMSVTAYEVLIYCKTVYFTILESITAAVILSFAATFWQKLNQVQLARQPCVLLFAGALCIWQSVRELG